MRCKAKSVGRLFCVGVADTEKCSFVGRFIGRVVENTGRYLQCCHTTCLQGIQSSFYIQLT